MMQKQSDKTGISIASAVGAYTIWGILPIYWKSLSQVSAMEILAHRMIWSFIFLICMLLIIGRMGQFYEEIRVIVARPRKLCGVLAASALITVNWLTYIWAVNNGRIIETSLGYYINPLVNVLLGIAVLKERLSFWQMVSVILAAAGVLNLTVHFGVIPWVAISLALSFGLYGLCKKLLNIGAITSITLETLLVSPPALVYLIYIHFQGLATFHFDSPAVAGLLAGSGVVTAIPMVLFTNSANYLPLTIIGFIQFLSPTIALIVGIFLYHETFSSVHLLSFSFIWLALLIFSFSKANNLRTLFSLATAKMKRFISNDRAGS